MGGNVLGGVAYKSYGRSFMEAQGFNSWENDNSFDNSQEISMQMKPISCTRANSCYSIPSFPMSELSSPMNDLP